MSKGQRIKAQRAAGQAAASSRSRGTRPGHVDSRRPIPWFAMTVGVIVVAALAALLWPADNKHATPAIKHAARTQTERASARYDVTCNDSELGHGDFSVRCY